MGGLIHFIFRLFIWRLIWRSGLLIWHIRTFGPAILLLIVGALAVWILVRWRRRHRTGPPPGHPAGGEGPAGAGPRDR